MKRITTPKGEILVLKIPDEQSDDFSIERSQDDFNQRQLQFPSGKFRGYQNYDRLNLPDGNWSILGAVNKKREVSFDCRDIVEYRNYEGYRGTWRVCYADYTKKHPLSINESTLLSYNDSFISLLEANGLYIDNPMGAKPSETFNHPYWEFRRAKWEEAEKNTLQENEMYLVLLRVNS